MEFSHPWDIDFDKLPFCWVAECLWQNSWWAPVGVPPYLALRLCTDGIYPHSLDTQVMNRMMETICSHDEDMWWQVWSIRRKVCTVAISWLCCMVAPTYLLVYLQAVAACRVCGAPQGAHWQSGRALAKISTVWSPQSVLGILSQWHSMKKVVIPPFIAQALLRSIMWLWSSQCPLNLMLPLSYLCLSWKNKWDMFIVVYKLLMYNTTEKRWLMK